MEQCYKLHGYHPGYKGKGKNSMANQVGGLDLGFMDSDAMPQQ